MQVCRKLTTGFIKVLQNFYNLWISLVVNVEEKRSIKEILIKKRCNSLKMHLWTVIEKKWGMSFSN